MFRISQSNLRVSRFHNIASSEAKSLASKCTTAVVVGRLAPNPRWVVCEGSGGRKTCVKDVAQWNVGSKRRFVSKGHSSGEE